MSLGHNRERAVKAWLVERGWWCIRAAGSLGEVDVVAIKASQYGDFGERRPRVKVIEVKATAGGPYEHFGPKDRAELLAIAEQTGGEAWLAYWPTRKPLTWIHSDEWPKSKE